MKMKANDFKNMPEEEMAMMIQGLLGLGYVGDHPVNGSAPQPDYSSPILKPVVARIYPLFIILYALPAALGIATNVLVMMYISKYKLNRDATQAFLVNLAVCHTVQCTFVLPITLMVMLLQNWIFGQFLCFFLPLLQDIPLHVAMISHLLIAWDRKRWLTDPLKARLPAFVCSCASWLAGMVIALPYPIYTTYLDLGKYLHNFEGVGICAVNLVDDMQEYMRGLFVIMYCGPMALLGYLYIRTSRELRPPDGPLSIMMFEARAEARSKQIRASRTGSAAGSAGAAASIGANLSASSRTYDLYDAEVDVNREKRTQRHLGAMASAQVLCVCPLMILRLARMTLVETYENQAHFDITYLMFVWIAFLPTVIVPWIYASWMLSRPAKERLRGYLRLSSRRNTKSEQSVDDGGGNSSPPGVKTPLSIQTNSSVGNHHSHQHQQQPLSKPLPQESSLVQKPSVKKQLPSIDRSKSPAGGSTRTQQSTLESTLAESSISNATTATAKSAVQSAPNGRPRRQLPPPLRIDNSNFHKTPSVKSRGSGGVQRSSLRSTAGRVGRTVGENLVDEEDDYAGSNITSSTYCNINEREVVAPPELYETMPLPRQNVLHKSASPYYQSDPNGREAHDMDSDSDIYQRQRPTRYGSLSKQDSGIVPHKPAGTPSIISISESEYSSRKGSLSTLSRDLEIIDRLERERSMNIQEMLQREKNYEYYLARQNSKLKFSTNFDDYFDEEPAQQLQKLPLVKQSSNSSHVPSQRSVSPHVPRNASNRRSSNLSYASTKRDSGYEQSLLETPPVAAPPVLTPGSHSASVAAAASSYRSNGPRRSLELEKQRIGRTYSGHSTRSSTRSRDRVSFHDDV